MHAGHAFVGAGVAEYLPSAPRRVRTVGHDDREVDDGDEDHEVDDRRDERTDVDELAVDVEPESRGATRADRVDQRLR